MRENFIYRFLLLGFLASFVLSMPSSANIQVDGSLSSEWEATAFNNGRRMVRDADGYFHVVYHSQAAPDAEPGNPPGSPRPAGILYCYSLLPADGNNPGPPPWLSTYWSQPVEVAATFEDQVDDRYPSIAIEYDANMGSASFPLNNDRLHVVWQRESYSGGPYDIAYTTRRNEPAPPPGSGVWEQNPGGLPGWRWLYQSGPEMNRDSLVPSICVSTSNVVHVVWQEEDFFSPNGNDFYSEILYKGSLWGTWNNPMAFDDIISALIDGLPDEDMHNSQMPSIASPTDLPPNYDYPGDLVYVAWNDDYTDPNSANPNPPHIWLNMNNVNGQPGGWLNFADISMMADTGEDGYPNLAVDNSGADHIVYMHKVWPHDPDTLALGRDGYSPGLDPAIPSSFPGPIPTMYMEWPNTIRYASLLQNVFNQVNDPTEQHDCEFPTVSIDQSFMVHVNWQAWWMETGEYDIWEDMAPSPPISWQPDIDVSLDYECDDLFPNLAVKKVGMYSPGRDMVWTKIRAGTGPLAAMAAFPKEIWFDGDSVWTPPAITPTTSPTVQPTDTPTPTLTPTRPLTFSPTLTPTRPATLTPTYTPTHTPTYSPTGAPTPTDSPTPRPTSTFTPVPTGTITPVTPYPIHQLASEWESTAFNNGRRMVRDADGYFHVVFHAQDYMEPPPTPGGACDIWYTHTIVPAPPTGPWDWVPAMKIVDTPEMDSRYPSIVIEHGPETQPKINDRLHVVWQEMNPETGAYDIFYISSPNSLTPPPDAWSGIRPIYTSQRNSLVPAIACSRDNILHVVWQEEDFNPLSEILYSRSLDNGTTWLAIPANISNTPETNSQMPSVACAVDYPNPPYAPPFIYDTEQVHVAWNDDLTDTAPPPIIWYTHSPDAGASWDIWEPITGATGGPLGNDGYPSIAVTKDWDDPMKEVPHVVWTHHVNPADPDTPGPYTPGQNPTWSTSFPGPKIGMYNTIGPGHVTYNHRLDTGWQMFEQIVMEPDDEFPNISVDNDNNLYVAWQSWYMWQQEVYDYEILESFKQYLGGSSWTGWYDYDNVSNDLTRDDLFPNLAYKKEAMYEPMDGEWARDMVWTKVDKDLSAGGHYVPAALSPWHEIMFDGNTQWNDPGGATPTPVPTSPPTNTPTQSPTKTAPPTDTPTQLPTDTFTTVPTDTPTASPTRTPSGLPSDTPTYTPTNLPTDTPTYTPTNLPTDTPTYTPTGTITPVTPYPIYDFLSEWESTAFNNGRRMVRDADGYFHVVFHARDPIDPPPLPGGPCDIWYTHTIIPAPPTGPWDWAPPMKIVDTPELDSRYPSIVIEHGPETMPKVNDRLHVVWQEMNPDMNAYDVFYISSPNSNTPPPDMWGPIQPIYMSQRNSLVPAIACSRDNILHVVWQEEDFTPLSEILYSRSIDNGLTWSMPANVSNTPDSNSQMPTIACAVDYPNPPYNPPFIYDTEQVHIAWNDDASGAAPPPVIWYTHSPDAGLSWDIWEPITGPTGQPLGNDGYPSIAVTKDWDDPMKEVPHVVWTHHVETADPDTPGPYVPGLDPTLPTSFPGPKIGMYYIVGPGHVTYNHRLDTGWQAFEMIVADPDDEFPNISVDNDNNLYVVWQSWFNWQQEVYDYEILESFKRYMGGSTWSGWFDPANVSEDLERDDLFPNLAYKKEAMYEPIGDIAARDLVWTKVDKDWSAGGHNRPAALSPWHELMFDGSTRWVDPGGATPTPVPTTPPTDTPTQSPTNTVAPTDTPTHEPTSTFTPLPTDTPTYSPTRTPTGMPSDTPTYSPTEVPTETPTFTPTGSVTMTPTGTVTIPTPYPIYGMASEWDSTAFNNGRRMVRDADGYFHVVFHAQNPIDPPPLPGGPCDIWYTHTILPAPPTGPWDWAIPVKIVETQQLDSRYPSIVIEHGTNIMPKVNDMLHVVWQEENPDTGLYDVWHISSPNSNTPPPDAWNNPMPVWISQSNSLVPAIACSRGNRLHVVWQEEDFTPFSEILYSRSIDHGNTWLPVPTNLSNTPETNSQMPTIACLIDYNNPPSSQPFIYLTQEVHVAWCDDLQYTAPPPVICYTHSPDAGTSWDIWEVITDPFGGALGNDGYPSIAVTKDWQEAVFEIPHVVWTHHVNPADPDTPGPYIPGQDPSLANSFPGPFIGMYSLLGPGHTVYSYRIPSAGWQSFEFIMDESDDEFPNISVDKNNNLYVAWQSWYNWIDNIYDYETFSSFKQWLGGTMWTPWFPPTLVSDDPERDDLFPNLAYKKAAMYDPIIDPYIMDGVWTKVDKDLSEGGHGPAAALSPWHEIMFLGSSQYTDPAPYTPTPTATPTAAPVPSTTASGIGILILLTSVLLMSGLKRKL